MDDAVDRLQALDACVSGGATDEQAVATSLLGNAEQYARSILEFAMGAYEVGQLKAIEWEVRLLAEADHV
jgi:hypothetical protein